MTEKIQTILNNICAISHDVFAELRPDLDCTVEPADLISKGKGKTRMSVSVARAFAIKVLHDHYAVTYKRIAEILRLSDEKSAMHIIRVLRKNIAGDTFYREINSRIMTAITNG